VHTRARPQREQQIEQSARRTPHGAKRRTDQKHREGLAGDRNRRERERDRHLGRACKQTRAKDDQYRVSEKACAWECCKAQVQRPISSSGSSFSGICRLAVWRRVRSGLA